MEDKRPIVKDQATSGAKDTFLKVDSIDGNIKKRTVIFFRDRVD
jgi:hypothetical protein